MKFLKRNIYANKKKRCTYQYETFLALWLGSMRRNLKESSYARYHQLVKTHIVPSLGTCYLEELTTQKISRQIQEFLTSGKITSNEGLSSKMVQDILSIIKCSISWCKAEGYAVPCDLAKLKVKKVNQKVRILNIKEQKMLQNTLVKNMNQYKLAVLVAMFTGLRIGELSALQWKDIDLNEQILHVRKTLQRIKNTSANKEGMKTKILISSPKSVTSIRDIPLPNFLSDLLKEYEAKQKPKAVDFLASGECRAAEPRILQYHFKKYLKQSNLDNVKFHTLRHTFASRCIEAGFDVKCLSEILGHASVNITLNRYVHISYQLKKNNMNKLSLL